MRPGAWKNVVSNVRNPWRMSFDRANGDLYIGDVGQNQWEEINFLSAGSNGGVNFGWSFYEGTHPYQGQPPQDIQLVPPVAEYAHDMGCSVTGGYVYRGSSLPKWQGIYLFGDYCTGHIWGLLKDDQGNFQQALLFRNIARISSFGEDEAGEIYLTDYSGNILTLASR